MPKVFYALLVGLVTNLFAYFYCLTSVFLIVLILSILLLFIVLHDATVEDVVNVISSSRDYLSSKERYKKGRRMSSFRRLSISERKDDSFNSGLLSDYDSRRIRTSVTSNNVTSPLRTHSKISGISYDENGISNKTMSPSNSAIHSPLRLPHGSPLRSSPLSHSKRFNINTEERNRRPRFSMQEEIVGSPSLLQGKKSSLSGSLHPGSPSFASRIASTANEMGVDQFPWISPTVPIIPIIQSPRQSLSSPRNGSPLRDATSNSSRRNRVRVRLTGPNRSDITLNSSSLDTTSTLDESSTTKSVIQALKEMSRKRTYMPTEDDEEQHEAKRRPPEHNLYLSRLEGEEDNSAPARTNGEDDRKRIREPDWDTSNVTGPKRRRKNTHTVNNEILSSLSSSIGLRQFSVTPVADKTKHTVSIGTQVSLIKDSTEKQQKEEGAQTILVKPAKEVKEAATMPDPPQPPRSRSPVKEKVVTNMNGILKSALSKFNIQPKEDSKISEGSIPVSSFQTPKADEPPKFLNPETEERSPLTGVIPQPTKSSLGQQSSLTSTPTGFQLPVSTPPNFSFGAPPSSSPDCVSENSNPVKTTDEKKREQSLSSLQTNKPSDSIEKKDEGKTELSGFIFNPPTGRLPNTDSPFKINSPTTSTAPAATWNPQPPTTSAGIFTIKSNETTAVSSASTTLTSPFTFGSPSSQTPLSSSLFSAPSTKAQETSSVSAPAVTAVSTQSVLQPTQNTSTAVKTTASSVSATEPFKFGTSAFTFKSKTSEDAGDKPKEDKQENSSTGIFSFGKVDNKPSQDNDKSVPANKPFQFGGDGGFSFGQAAQTNKSEGTVSNPFTQKTTSSSTVDTAKPAFTFSGNNAKLDNPFGSSGFAFKPLVSTTTPTTTNEQKSVVSFTGTPSSTTAASSIVNTSSPATTTAPVFPPSLFGSNGNTTVTTTSTAAAAPTVSSTGNTLTSFASAKPVFGDASKTFTLATTSATPTFGSNSSGFGSGGSSLFSSTTGNNQTNSTNIFGSTTGNTGTNPISFSSTPAFGGTSNPPSFSATTTVFGSTPSSTNPPLFGSTVAATAPTFGNPTTTAGTTTFGTTGTPTPSFGSTASSGSVAPAFGGGLVANTSSPAFGASGSSLATTPSFGVPSTTSSSIFGSTTGTTTPSFGSSTGAATPSFGSSTGTTTPSFGSSTGTTTPSFGTTGTTNPAQSTFGSTQTNVPSFGSNAPSPAFGSTSTSGFGSSGTSSTTFGGQPQATAFGTQSGSTFGSAPAFGQAPAPSTFGSQAAFGSQNTTPAPAFGSTSTFGSSTTFNTTATPAAPAFGSSSTTFGSSSTFGGQEASKPFTFNAPSGQPAASGTFNFTAPQPPQAAGSGLFQFGASTSTQPNQNQPFQFNAAQPSTPVGATGQQMFSIGSGSTAPRRMTARRKK